MIDAVRTKNALILSAQKYSEENLIGSKQDFLITTETSEIFDPPDYIFNIFLPGEIIKYDAEKSLVTREYSLRHFLKLFYDSLRNRLGAKYDSVEEIISDKTHFCKYASIEIHNYLDSIPKEKQPRPYKLQVIVGYLAVSFGLIVNREAHSKSGSKITIYNSFLQDSVKHFFKKGRAKVNSHS